MSKKGKQKKSLLQRITYNRQTDNIAIHTKRNMTAEAPQSMLQLSRLFNNFHFGCSNIFSIEWNSSKSSLCRSLFMVSAVSVVYPNNNLSSITCFGRYSFLGFSCCFQFSVYCQVKLYFYLMLWKLLLLLHKVIIILK